MKNSKKNNLNILLISKKYFKILQNTAFFLKNTAKYKKILKNTAKYYTLLQTTANY
jgi:hypothetical protein